MRERGIPKDKIITFVYDDITENPTTLTKGTFSTNQGIIVIVIDIYWIGFEGGRDVCPSCAKGYAGKDVKKKNFLDALTGDAETVRNVNSVRVSDPSQHIVTDWSGHGSIGVV